MCHPVVHSTNPFVLLECRWEVRGAGEEEGRHFAMNGTEFVQEGMPFDTSLRHAV